LEDAGEAAFRQTSPISPSTLHRDVFELAKDWIKECAQSHQKCRPASETAWHPTRLLDLESVLDPNNSIAVVRLVSQKDCERRNSQPEFEGEYVTLSHCWGKGEFIKLTRETLSDFQSAMPLKQLPLTFQHAVQFACELKVRWLWIDALCILQGDDEDWFFESAQMDKVYTYSYCNISATASTDSSGGLFHSRNISRKWFESVTLRITGLDKDPRDTVRCTISDLSFWATCVENAPANRRAWVFQERLLAPRVVHWCKDQIAFECRESDRAECRPEGLPHFQLKGGELIDEARLKGMDKEIGKRLREIRLASWRRASSSGKDVNSKLLFYEIWKRMVEVYTKMELTHERDRLIALSGIARMMTSTMKAEGIDDKYLAGMWHNYMASQLLWYVNEAEGDARQPFENNRTKKYRAPTFSWASVETRRGITFAETTDQGVLVHVQVVRLSYQTEDDVFGLVTDGYLVLKGVLRKIVLTDRAESAQAPVSGWASVVSDVHSVKNQD
jgi:Heterokaryon incompatibility protein (HET)